MADILVVDDSASMRHMVKFTLEMDGHVVTEGSDGEKGLELTKSKQFDLVITDVNMPKMNGIEMTGKIRKLSNYKSVPVLLLTTESGLSKKQEGKSAGATGWLVKPFDPAKLSQTVSKVIA